MVTKFLLLVLLLYALHGISWLVLLVYEKPYFASGSKLACYFVIERMCNITSLADVPFPSLFCPKVCTYGHKQLFITIFFVQIGSRFIKRRLVQRFYDRVLAIGLQGYAMLYVYNTFNSNNCCMQLLLAIRLLILLSI